MKYTTKLKFSAKDFKDIIKDPKELSKVRAKVQKIYNEWHNIKNSKFLTLKKLVK